MPLYMHQWSYKDQQIKQMLLEDADRAEIVRIAIESFDGKMLGFYYCFGSYDGVALADFPTSRQALASVLAISAQGRINYIHTTPLFTPEEGLQAMREATEAIKNINKPPPHPALAENDSSQ